MKVCVFQYLSLFLTHAEKRKENGYLAPCIPSAAAAAAGEIHIFPPRCSLSQKRSLSNTLWPEKIPYFKKRFCGSGLTERRREEDTRRDFFSGEGTFSSSLECRGNRAPWGAPSVLKTRQISGGFTANRQATTTKKGEGHLWLEVGWRKWTKRPYLFSQLTAIWNEQ